MQVNFEQFQLIASDWLLALQFGAAVEVGHLDVELRVKGLWNLDGKGQLESMKTLELKTVEMNKTNSQQLDDVVDDNLNEKKIHSYLSWSVSLINLKEAEYSDGRAGNDI